MRTPYKKTIGRILADINAQHGINLQLIKKQRHHPDGKDAWLIGVQQVFSRDMTYMSVAPLFTSYRELFKAFIDGKVPVSYLDSPRSLFMQFVDISKTYGRSLEEILVNLDIHARLSKKSKTCPKSLKLVRTSTICL